MTVDPILIVAILAIISAACTGLSNVTANKAIEVCDAFGKPIGKMLSPVKKVSNTALIHLAWITALAAGATALADWAY